MNPMVSYFSNEADSGWYCHERRRSRIERTCVHCGLPIVVGEVYTRYWTRIEGETRLHVEVCHTESGLCLDRLAD